MIEAIQSVIKVTGVYRFSLATLKTKEQKDLSRIISERRQRGLPYLELVRHLNTLCCAQIFEDKNMIVTSGLTLIANNFAETAPDNVPKLNYTALGTASTAVSAGQTKLVTEYYRREVASSSNSAAILYLTAYYDATETSGLFKEAGVFADATGTADSGVLFSRTLLNAGAGINKTTSQTLTLDYTVTFTSS